MINPAKNKNKKGNSFLPPALFMSHGTARISSTHASKNNKTIAKSWIPKKKANWFIKDEASEASEDDSQDDETQSSSETEMGDERLEQQRRRWECDTPEESENSCLSSDAESNVSSDAEDATTTTSAGQRRMASPDSRRANPVRRYTNRLGKYLGQRQQYSWFPESPDLPGTDVQHDRDGQHEQQHMQSEGLLVDPERSNLSGP